jgi:hypothetical protein
MLAFAVIPEYRRSLFDHRHPPSADVIAADLSPANFSKNG